MQIQSKKIPLLGAILGVQLVIASVLFFRSHEPVATVNRPLLAIDAASVDRLVIDGEQALELNKDGDQWRLGNGLPVRGPRVENLIDSLAKLKSQWPVANSVAAAERFDVADDKFKRKVTLFSGDTNLGSLLMGTSPGINQCHIRVPGDEAIYALRFSVFEATTDADEWLDNTLLQPAGDIIEVSSEDYTLAKVDGKWPAPKPKAEDTAAESVKDEESDAENTFDVAAFSNTLAELRVVGIADDIAALDVAEKDAASGDAEALGLIQWTIKTTDKEYQYQLLNKDDQYYIRRNDYDQTFGISKYHYGGLKAIKKKGLSVAKS